MKISITTLFIILFSNVIFGQKSSNWVQIDSKEYLSAIVKLEESIPLSESYYLKINNLVFSDYETKLPYQHVVSELKCEAGHLFNIHSNGVLIVQDKGINLTIDTLNNQIYLQNEEEKYHYRKQPDDYLILADLAKRFFKSIDGELVTYYLEFQPGYEITGIELTLDNEWFKKMVYYSATPINHYEFPDQLARFEISIDTFKKGKKSLNGPLIHPKDILSVQADRLILQPKYEKYEVIDLRKN